jgi:ABC-type nitrate/sulfonate/bicarbonate transport system substrate-binding protein
LNVCVGVVDPGFAQLWLGKLRGYYGGQKLIVNINVVGSNAITLLVSGSCDLVIQGSTGSTTPVSQGISTTIIYATSAHGDAAYAIAKSPSIRNVQQCTRIGSSNIGSAAYAWATIENNLFNIGATVIPNSSTGVTIAALQSGNVDCAVGAYSSFAGLVTAGQAHIILDPTNYNALPVGFVKFIANDDEASIFGLTSNLKKKRTLIVKFLRGYQKALKEANTADPAEVANVLHTSKDWETMDVTGLANAIKNQDYFNAPNKGFLTKAMWTNALQFFIQAGQSFVDPKDPKWSYAQRVDMSYYKAATAPPVKKK